MDKKLKVVQQYLDNQISTARFEKEYFRLLKEEHGCEPVMKTTDFVLKSNDPDLISKCVQRDDMQLAESSYQEYRSRERIEKTVLIKNAEEEIENVIREFNRVYEQDVTKAGETREKKEARLWNSRQDLWERFSAANRVLNSQ